MANKRIQKKRAKAAEYRKRINLIADLVVFLCPNDTKHEKRKVGLALWKLSDWDLYRIYSHETLRRSPFRRMIPRSVCNVPVVKWAPITAYRKSAIDLLIEEVRK